MMKAITYSVGIVSPQRIDQINILQATYEAMQQAICKLNPAPDMLLVDAVTIPEVTTKQVGIVKGDAKSVSIAAASILAKVTRDRMMVELDEAYPEYGFAQHKGYGSAAHIEALKKRTMSDPSGEFYTEVYIIRNREGQKHSSREVSYGR